MLIEGIDFELIGHPEIDQQGTRKAGGQTDQVEQSKAAILYEVAPGYLKVVLEHMWEYMSGCQQKGFHILF